MINPLTLPANRLDCQKIVIPVFEPGSRRKPQEYEFGMNVLSDCVRFIYICVSTV